MVQMELNYMFVNIGENNGGEFLVIKPTRCTNFSNLFWNKTLHVSDSSSVHHQEFSTVHTAMVYVIEVLLTACEQDQDGPS